MERVVVLKDLISILEKEFPLHLAEDWDNVGLIVGDDKAIVNNVQISLDLTESVIDRAIKNKVELIITHHPLIFSSIKKINNKDILGRKILKLIKNGINVYTMHTNLDSALEGLNEYVAQKLNGKNIRVLNEIGYDLFKMAVYVPKTSYVRVQELVDTCPELELLGYKNVSYNSFVIERINKGEVEENENYKIEVIGERNKLNSLLNKIKQIHEYKEPAYEIVKIENKYKTGMGIGRVFEVEETNFDNYVEVIKETFGIKNVKVVKANEKRIKKVAIVNGSGAGMWKKALKSKADLFITGDIKYHEALDAFEAGINLVDIGHYEAEYFFGDLIIKKIGDNLKVEVYNEREIFEFR